MTIRLCPHCGEGKQARGFHFHEIACKAKRKLNPLRKRYALQLKNMTPEQADKFLSKAGGV